MTDAEAMREFMALDKRLTKLEWTVEQMMEDPIGTDDPQDAAERMFSMLESMAGMSDRFAQLKSKVSSDGS